MRVYHTANQKHTLIPTGSPAYHNARAGLVETSLENKKLNAQSIRDGSHQRSSTSAPV